MIKNIIQKTSAAKIKKAFSLIELSVAVLIIGILIAGISHGMRLVEESKLKTARFQTKSSTVTSIGGIVFWMDATSENAFDSATVNDGDAVTTWYDMNPLSTTKHNFTQSTSSKKPTYETGLINGLPGLSFDGSDDFLITSSLLSTEFSPNNTNTVFLVAKIYSGTVFFKFQTSTSNRFGMEINSGFFRFDFPNDTTGALMGSSVVTGTNYLFTTHHSSTTQTIYKNGSSYDSKANALSFSTTFTSVASIGAETDTTGTTGSLHTKINIGEIIAYDHSLSTLERQDVESYLMKKWGLRAS